MGIEDIQISEELETNAPSIKYSGNEGPKSPQEMEQMMIASLEEEYAKYVFEMEEQGIQPMSLRQFMDQAMAEGQMSKGPILPSDEDPINPFQPKPQGPTLPNRQMAAYGGIMGLDGRRKYGIGSSLKKIVRKVIPNEVAAVAEKAAPFIALAAPQFALPAALAGGLGKFDRTGSIGDSLKSGLMTYGLGTLSPGLPGVRDMGPQSGMFTTQPFGGKYNVSNLFKSKSPADLSKVTEVDKGIPTGQGDYDIFGKKIKETASSGVKGLTDKIKDYAMNNKLATFLLAKEGVDLLSSGPEEVVSEIMDRGEGLDLDSIRLEVREAFKDPSGKKLAALRNKYPYLGTQASKDVANMAMGGRIGKAEGGIMDLGGMEKDYRAEGGFVPIGREEKADDVPARLSVNEFVFTADAVRNAGGGDIDQGAEIMERVMKNLEQGGQISEETQGMSGAQEMFNVSERLSEVV